MNSQLTQESNLTSSVELTFADKLTTFYNLATSNPQLASQ